MRDCSLREHKCGTEGGIQTLYKYIVHREAIIESVSISSSISIITVYYFHILDNGFLLSL